MQPTDKPDSFSAIKKHPGWRGKRTPKYCAKMSMCLALRKPKPPEMKERHSELMKKWHQEHPDFNTIHHKGIKMPAKSESYRQRASDQALEQHRSGNLGSHTMYSRCEKGWWTDGKKKYFMRSKWEMNYATYLNWLIEHKEIKAWEYETETFWFEKIRRGVRSYKPDFKVTNNNDSIEFHEVKGWMDKKSATKIKRMALYYPQIKLIVVDEDGYKGIKKFSRMIHGWID